MLYKRMRAGLWGVVGGIVCLGSVYAQQTPTTPLRSGPTLGEIRVLTQGGTTVEHSPGARGATQRPPMPAGSISSSASVSTIISGGGSEVRVVRGSGQFEPSRMNAVDYGDPPSASQDIKVTLTGPMNAVQFLDTLSLATNWNIVASLAVERITLRFWMTEMSPKQALEVLKFHDIYYEFDEETDFLYVMTRDEYIQREYGQIIDHEFVIQYADLGDMEVVLQSLLSSSGRLVVSPRTAKILVYDTADNIAHMKKAVKELDVPRRVVALQLRYVDAERVVDSLEGLLSDGGELRVDARANTIIVLDRPSNLEQIASVIEILDRRMEVRSWRLNYADAERVAEQLAVLVPEEMGSVYVDEANRQITVRAIPERLDEIDALIARWDYKRRQVQIEAYLLTASSSVARNLGIRWSAFGGRDNDLFGVQFGNADPRFTSQPDSGQRLSLGQFPAIIPVLDPVTGDPLLDLAGNVLVNRFTGSDLSVVLDSLETTGDVKILAHPRITVQDGQEAVFENTTSVPFAQSNADRPVSVVNASGGLTTAIRTISRIDFIDVGTILRVLPRITDDGNVLMDISSEDSTFIVQIVKSADQESTVPQKTQNKAETQVLVRDRETVVIGGLRTSNFADTVDKVPILGDLPFVGRLFRATSKDHKHSELLIFITPTIMDEMSHPETIRLAQVDQDFAETMRYDRKGSMERGKEWLTGGRREIFVSIGHRGHIFADGKLINLFDIEAKFAEVKRPRNTMVLIRRHPRASEDIATAIAEFAGAAGMRVEFDDETMAIVPGRN